MRRILLGVFLLLAACAPMPIPTTVPLPTATVLPTPTFTASPTAMPSATETLTPVAMPTLFSTITPIALDKNPRAILIEADEFGGMTRIPRDAHVPVFRLYADGFVVFAGEAASLATGLDAVARVGRLSESQIQNLLASLTLTGFFALKDYYEPRPKPTDAPTAYISVFLTKVKTVSVYAFDAESAPKNFSDAFAAIKHAIPADAQTYTPMDGYLAATSAGSVSELGAGINVSEWKDAGVRLADVGTGVNVSGNTFTAVAALIAKRYPESLYREGDRAYRVRFSPNLPRAAPLTDSIGTILNAPREFDGRVFDIVGYFRGWNVYGEARGSPPVTRSDWVITDASGAIYVTGALPRGLDPSSRADAWTLIRLRGAVNYVRLGTSYLEVRRVEILPSDPSPSASTPTSTPSSTATPGATRTVQARTATPAISSGADAAIAAVKAQFPKVANIKPSGAGMIGATTNITVIAPRVNEWWLVFWEGWGDCPAGCINNRYSYFSVDKDGRATQAGEYARIFNSDKNTFDITGAPMWSIPK